MCEQSRVYNDGDIVWVKLSNCWWPGEVHGDDKLPSDMVAAFKKKRPYAVVKFFQEDSYEYVKNLNNIYTYCCPRRLDFIRKGLDLYQANHKYMEMFPADVATAERRTKGDPDIINDPAVLNPAKQTSSSKRWAEIVSDTGGKKASPVVVATAKRSSVSTTPNSKTLVSASPSGAALTVRPNKEHEVRILSSSTNRSLAVNPVSGGVGLASSPTQQLYKCHLCNFSSSRMNLLILHSKSHSSAGSGSDATLDSRRNSLANRSTTSSTMTPTKRFSTTSSCSTPSPALSPVSSPAPAPPPLPPVTMTSSSRTPAANKSRPPKKRTKRMSSSSTTTTTTTDEHQSPHQPTPPPPPKQSASSKPPSSTRRSRHRRRSSTPPMEEAVEEAPVPTETVKSPLAVPVLPSNSRNVKLSLLKDWSDDDEEPEAEKTISTSPEKVNIETKQAPLVATATTTTPLSLVSPGKTTPPTDVSSPGRSSPIRCRNIPKKDRRDVVYEEFKPKILPNRTPKGPGDQKSVPDPIIADQKEEEEEEVPEPIVQKKKKAVIERLSQQAQDEVVASPKAVTTDPLVERQPSPLQSSIATPPPNEDEPNNNQMESESVAATPASTSCFDFEEDSQPPTVAANNNGDEVLAGKPEMEEEEKIKRDLEQKDQELLAEIGNILSSTSELAEATAGKAVCIGEEVSPAKAKLSDMSLPPKERGKRIFKSRNSNLASSSPEVETVALKEEVVKEEEPHEQTETNRLEQPLDGVSTESNADVKEEEKEAVEKQVDEALPEVLENAVQEPQPVDPIAAAQTVPRKRKFDTTVLVETEVDSSPESKVRRVSSPGPVEQQAMEEKEKDKVCEARAVAMEVDVEEKSVATKPKINSSSAGEASLAATTNNGDAEKCPSVSTDTSSPMKANDLLAAKGVQKVQIVQRVRAQDGSETMETKVAKISSADSANVLTVAIAQSGPMVVEEEVSPVPEADEVLTNSSAVNGSAHQESPTTRTVSASTVESNGSPEAAAANSDPQILAIPAETFDGPVGSFYLCTVDDGNFIPIDNQPLYLDASNQLVPTPPTLSTVVVMDGDVEEIETEELITEGDEEVLPQIVIGPDEHVVDLTDTEAKYILNTGTGQQILLDLQSLLTIASGGEAPRLVCDGHEMVIEGTPQEILSSITLSTSEFDEQQQGHDIIGAALADTGAMYPTVSTAYVSETNAVLTQPPIMSALEVPSKADATVRESGSTNLEESLAEIGVKKEVKTIPASLELPITITNPKIAAKTTQASIKSVYMTTTAVCGSKMETQTEEYWATTTTGVVNEAEPNGHEQEDQIVMVVEEEEVGEQQEKEAGDAEEVAETAIIVEEASEFAM